MNIKTITRNGLGIALFVALSLCLQVPVFQNYYLCLGYIVMAVYLYFFGIKSGAVVGVLGTILYCFLINGLRGLPGWATGNIVIAIIFGYSLKLEKKINIFFVKYIVSIVGVVIGCLGGILLAKSLVEHLLYTQPIIVRMVSNMYAFVADVVVLMLGFPVCKFLEPYVKKHSHSKKDKMS